MSGVVPLFGSSWSSKQFCVPETRSICAFGPEEEGKGIIYVLGISGIYYSYSWTAEATECKLETIGHYLK